jgi:hypothetical protein
VKWRQSRLEHKIQLNVSQPSSLTESGSSFALGVGLSADKGITPGPQVPPKIEPALEITF